MLIYCLNHAGSCQAKSLYGVLTGHVKRKHDGYIIVP